MSIQVIDISPTVAVLRTAAKALAESQPLTAELVRMELERIQKLCEQTSRKFQIVVGPEKSEVLRQVSLLGKPYLEKVVRAMDEPTKSSQGAIGYLGVDHEKEIRALNKLLRLGEADGNS